MTTQVIVLNGGSSSGKSTLARALQDLLPDLWLACGADTLVQLAPAALDKPGGLVLGADGGVTVGPRFRALEEAWAVGVAAMARSGARVILDEVFLGGAAGQERWLRLLDGLPVLWVGVRCAASVAEERERARGDRVVGMARSQAESVHEGGRYDLEVDTARTATPDCARAVAARL